MGNPKFKTEVEDAFKELKEYHDDLQKHLPDVFGAIQASHPYRTTLELQGEDRAYKHALMLLSDILGEPNNYYD